MALARVGWMLLGCLGAFVPAQVRAQGYGQGYGPEMESGVTGPLVWNIGGTAAFPLGGSSDRTNTGYGFAVGLTYNATPPLGVQFEYGADWSDLKTGGALASAGIDGNAFLQYFNVNAVLRPAHAGPVSFYLVGGGGLYYRRAEVTRVEGTVVVPYCDPWLFYCSATPVSAVSVLGSRNSWDWGLDGGVGLTFAAAPPVRVYLEVRYHYIFGPSFTNSTGQERSANGQYLPVTLGVRF